MSGIHMRAMVTGHRDINEDAVAPALDRYLDSLLRTSSEVTVISGGAKGADKLWARIAYLKGVPYEIYVPRGYGEHYFRGDDLESFNAMLEHASRIEWTQDPGVPFNWSFNHIRNHSMVDTATAHIAVSRVDPREVTEDMKGGTNHCIRVMKKRNVHHVLWVHADTGQATLVHP